MFGRTHPTSSLGAIRSPSRRFSALASSDRSPPPSGCSSPLGFPTKSLRGNLVAASRGLWHRPVEWDGCALPLWVCVAAVARPGAEQDEIRGANRAATETRGMWAGRRGEEGDILVEDSSVSTSLPEEMIWRHSRHDRSSSRRGFVMGGTTTPRELALKSRIGVGTCRNAMPKL